MLPTLSELTGIEIFKVGWTVCTLSSVCITIADPASASKIVSRDERTSWIAVVKLFYRYVLLHWKWKGPLWSKWTVVRVCSMKPLRALRSNVLRSLTINFLWSLLNCWMELFDSWQRSFTVCWCCDRVWGRGWFHRSRSWNLNFVKFGIVERASRGFSYTYCNAIVGFDSAGCPQNLFRRSSNKI